MRKIFKRVKQFPRHPLGKRFLFRAVFRYLTFHIKQSLFPQLRIYPFVEGVKFYAEKGMAGIVGNIYLGLHEFEEMTFLLHFLSKGDVFLDVGANVGAYSLLAGGVRQASCFAVEPLPQTFEQLEKNVKLNNLSCLIKCFQIGFGDAESVLHFSNDKGTMNHVVKNADGSCAVPVRMIDHFIQHQDAIPGLVKIDVEGFELPVLRGGRKLFSNPDCEAVIIEINGSGKRYGFSNEEIHNFMLSHQFQPVSYDPFSRKLKRLPSFNERAFNTIYVKNFERVQERLLPSPPVRVFSQSI